MTTSPLEATPLFSYRVAAAIIILLLISSIYSLSFVILQFCTQVVVYVFLWTSDIIIQAVPQSLNFGL